ncbi:MAG: hypothetical protein HY690_20730 [Chloroflexi bacterium]|nr:hypothetical protein [Chloroflexota bacterium]
MADVAAFADSGPLVYFAKLTALHILQAILGAVGVPPAVYQETVAAGKLRGKPDATAIERALDMGVLVRHESVTSLLELQEQAAEMDRLLSRSGE